MKPYFQNHSAGWLFLIVVICFFGMEIIQFFRQRRWRKTATRIVTPRFWVGVGVWVIFATVILHRAGHYWPGAAMEHGALVFTLGMTLLIAGADLRWWSFWALGQYFTFTVDVSPDQQVVTAGPYRVLRHPGYAGGLLAMIGMGVSYTNWIGLAGFTLTAPQTWRTPSNRNHHQRRIPHHRIPLNPGPFAWSGASLPPAPDAWSTGKRSLLAAAGEDIGRRTPAGTHAAFVADRLLAKCATARTGSHEPSRVTTMPPASRAPTSCGRLLSAVRRGRPVGVGLRVGT